MAVERVREGEAPSAVIASYGFCRTTIYKWLTKAKRGGRGVLRSRRALAVPIRGPRRKSARYSGGSTARILANTALISVCGRGRSSPS